MGDLLAGAHMSIAGGLYKAFERGVRAECRTIQVFLKNSNRWEAKPLTELDRSLFLEKRNASGIGPVLAHDSYLINLASPDTRLYKKSREAFIEELKRADFLEIPYLVLHPGSHMGSGVEEGIQRVARALNRAIDTVGPKVTILIENTSGQGNCLDTCHLFAAGYDIRTVKKYEATLREFDRLLGIKTIKAIHVNDSKKDMGSRVDRHCHIGHGFIGLEAFRCLVNDRRFKKIPKILETPKGPDLKEDRMNLATLKSLMK